MQKHCPRRPIQTLAGPIQQQNICDVLSLPRKGARFSHSGITTCSRFGRWEKVKIHEDSGSTDQTHLYTSSMSGPKILELLLGNQNAKVSLREEVAQSKEKTRQGGGPKRGPLRARVTVVCYTLPCATRERRPHEASNMRANTGLRLPDALAVGMLNHPERPHWGYRARSEQPEH